MNRIISRFLIICIFPLMLSLSTYASEEYVVPPEPMPRPSMNLEEIRKNSRMKNFELVGHISLTWPGGGSQIAISDNILYVAQMPPSVGIDIIDISNPADPELVGHVNPPDAPRVHSHKVRVCGNIMVINNERNRFLQPDEWKGGVGIYDISDKTHPKLISFLDVPGSGVHRMFFDCSKQRLFINASNPGFLDWIEWVVDLKDPKKPVVISKLWHPGQKDGEKRGWIPGHFQDPLPKKEIHPHNCIPYKDRLYAAWWDAGLTIWDISDIENPRMIGNRSICPPTQGAMHGAYPILGYPLVVTADEWFECPSGYVRIWDIRDVTNPLQISTFQLPISKNCPEPVPGVVHTAHGIAEPKVMEWQDWPLNLIFMTWSNQGLRVIDISDPYIPVEAGYFELPAWPGSETTYGNTPPSGAASDLTVDWPKKLVYVTDRTDHGGGGLYILRWTGDGEQTINFIE